MYRGSSHAPKLRGSEVSSQKSEVRGFSILTTELIWRNPIVLKRSKTSKCFNALTGFRLRSIGRVCRFRPSSSTGWAIRFGAPVSLFAPISRKVLPNKAVRWPNPSDNFRWRSAPATRCGFGRVIAWTWIISIRRHGGGGETRITKSRKCCKAYRESGTNVDIGNFLISDF